MSTEKDLTDAILAAHSLVDTLHASGIPPMTIASAMMCGAVYAYGKVGFGTADIVTCIRGFSEAFEK